MDGQLTIHSPQVYFIADTHFRDPAGPGERERRKRFAALLEGVVDDATVILLGDVFDFFFEYRAFVLKRYFDVFYALRRCRDRGACLHFIGGNHDFWVGDFLRDEIGVETHEADNLLVSVQKRVLCCSHGDLTLPGDDNYRRVRSIIRNRAIIAMARLLHPDLMNAIATRVSNGSRQRRRRTQEEIAAELAALAPHQFFDKGNDAFIMGHVHYPLHRRYDDKDFLIVGDWIDNYTYGRLENGQLTLERASA